MHALSFGELLWDIIEGEEHIGGAPFNLAAHLAQMGADSALVSSVGKDELGRRALDYAAENGVGTEFVGLDEGLETGTVLVELDEKGSPTYDIREGSAWDRIALSEEQLKKLELREWDVLAFGSLAQRTEGNRAVLTRLVEKAAPAELFFDVNLRQNYYSRDVIADSLRLASILKLNDDEVPEISTLLYGEKILDRAFCERMEKEWGIHTVCITRGKQGASICTRGEYFHVPVIPVSVGDTVGAGDSFSAAFLYGYFTTGDVRKAGNLASLVSSFVASKNGAIPSYDEPVRKAIDRVKREAEESADYSS